MDEVAYIFFWICLSLVLCCTGCCTISYCRRRGIIQIEENNERNQVYNYNITPITPTPQELYRVQIRTV
jgi:hypothetical protein